MTAPEANPTEIEGAAAAQPGAKSTVTRNTAFLVVAQVLSMPLSMLNSAVMARKLGPEDFGYIFLANNFIAFGFLVVEWGQAAALTALIARDRSVAGAALGSGIAWRIASAMVTYAVLAGIAKVVQFGTGFQGVLALVVAARLVGTICAACLDTARGLERSAPTAVSLVRYNLLTACLLVPTLYAGGGLYGALAALFFADLINTSIVCFQTRSLNIGKLRLERPMLNTLLRKGVPFMLLGLALNLQPLVDSTMLSQLATPEVIGWYAAARKLIGVLIFPVTALTGALYPTLCRLYGDDIAEFRRLMSTALRVATILVVPVTVGTGMFPKLGVMIFSESSFGPAEDNLRVLSCFVLLVYFTMVLSVGIQASGRERLWTATQFACVVVSAIVDPILIPWFQRHSGNGGLGVCVAAVLSEVLMLVAGLAILPRGVLDRAFAKGVGRAFAAGAAMAGVALLSATLNPFVGALLSAIAYGATLYAIGGVDQDTLRSMKSIALRKVGRG